MGYLRACLSGVALASFAACGGGDSKPDALIIVPDAPPDAKPIDAPPDALQYDFSCATTAFPTTAPAQITAAGTTATLSAGAGTPIPAAAVQIFKKGTVAAIVNTTSDANGAWTSGNVATGGVPFDGFIHASHADDGATKYRSTYVFPPEPLAMSVPQVPTLMVTEATFAQIANFANPPQNDTTNGVVIVLVNDCAGTLVAGATLTAKQGATDVGQVFDLGSLLPQAAGVYFIFNVPDGDTVVNAAIDAHTFHAHTVKAFKKSMGATADVNGTVTTTIVRPGPL
jgi:hypothetical protein